VSTLRDLHFENSFSRLNPAFFEVVDPTPLPEPYLVAFNPAAAELLDLDPSVREYPELLSYLSGNQRLPGAEPLAQAYAGHQFGVWVPQLGDGRAFLLGEVRNSRGESWDLHLKGAGRTRFSRFGDGRSVLRSAVREFLASEALHGLGIPTTRALSIVGSELPVYREQVETAAVLLRLSPSHVRFGTFQYYAARGETDRVRELADYVLERHYPALLLSHRERSEAIYLACFGEVCRRTARLIAQWMASGFAHGVMNTDNMSILGLTLDYGPYGFLDEYDAGFICNHSDTGGRYAFDQQPAVGWWNCARLGESLLQSLRGGKAAEASGSGASHLRDDLADAWQEELDSYRPAFTAEYLRLMRGKLGINGKSTDDTDDSDQRLIDDLLEVLQSERLDYALFFRELCGHCVNGEQSTMNSDCSSDLKVWLARYAARLRAEGSIDAERAERMRKTNPRYVLRNWVAQEAIEQAQTGRFDLIEQLRRMIADPYAEHPGMERFAEPPPAGAREIAVSCSS